MSRRGVSPPLSIGLSAVFPGAVSERRFQAPFTKRAFRASFVPLPSLARLLLFSLHEPEGEDLMRAMGFVLAASTVLATGACSRTENGDVVVKRPADVSVKTTQDTLHMPTVTTHTDTVNTPVIGTKTETLVVKKPVLGTKKTEVQVPQVKKP